MKVILLMQKNGVITKRYHGVRDLVRTNALPVITVDTEEEADKILVRFCKRTYDNKSYRLVEFDGTLEAMEYWGEVFQAFVDTGEVPRTGSPRVPRGL